MNKNTNNKKPAPVKVVRMPEDQVKEIMDGLITHVDKHIEETVAKLDNKSVAVNKSDVKKSVKEVLTEKKVIPEEAEEKEEVKEVKEVKEVEEVEEEDDGNLQFDWKQVGKYFLAGLFGFGAGAAGKVAYDKVQMNRKAKKAEAAMSSANYEGIYEEV